MRYLERCVIRGLALLTIGCGLISTGSPYAKDYAGVVRAESVMVANVKDTVYQRRMRDLIRRSRLIPMDSLARLNVLLTTVPDTALWRVRQAMACEGFELIWRYGLVPMIRAENRMADSLRRAGFDIDHQEARLARVRWPDPEIGNDTCNPRIWSYPRLPDSLGLAPYPGGGWGSGVSARAPF